MFKFDFYLSNRNGNMNKVRNVMTNRKKITYYSSNKENLNVSKTTSYIFLSFHKFELSTQIWTRLNANVEFESHQGWHCTPCVHLLEEISERNSIRKLFFLIEINVVMKVCSRIFYPTTLPLPLERLEVFRYFRNF